MSRHLDRYGVVPTAVYAFLTAAWQIRAGRVGLLMRLGPGGRTEVPEPAGLTIRSLSADEALDAADPHNRRFQPATLRMCIERGDRCVAALSGTSVVGSAWFATGAVRQLGAWWRPVAPAVLEHLVWVHPSMRGKRIAAAITARFRQENPDAPVLAVVEVGNYAERRSMQRAGYTRVGLLAQFGPERWNAGIAAHHGHLTRCAPPSASSVRELA